LKNGVSLFIPVYNSAGLIRRNLRKSYGALLELHGDFEIIIVDDNSTDKSYRFGCVINKAKQVSGREIKYVFYNKGPSRRENLVKSFYLAKNEIIGFIDSDFSINYRYLLKAIEILKVSSADIVIGSRYIPGARFKMRKARRIFSFLYNFLLRILFRSCLMDHQCGLKVFRKDTTMPIIDKMGYDDKFIRGWFWDAEFLIRAQKAKLKIIEMPIEWHCSGTSTFDVARELRCLRAIFKLKKDIG
jgi:glycosyltransferase involved in cell wall biosynthesis